METGSSILGYKGDANLGIGAGAGIPVSGGGDLSAINDMAKNIMLEEHQNNINLFNQKIKDRDTLLQAIDDGSVAVGDVAEGDKHFFDEYKNKANKALDEMIKGGGIKNEKAYQKYKDSIRDLKDVTTMLQSRKVELSKLEQDRANAKLPSEQKRIDDHIKKEKERLSKNPLDTFKPIQTALSIDIPVDIYQPTVKDSFVGGTGAVTTTGTTPTGTTVGGFGTPTTTTQKTTTTAQAGKQPKTTTTTTTAPVKGKQSETPVGEIVVEGGRVYDIKRGYVDANIIRKNALLKGENEENAVKQRMHLDYIQNPLNANPSMPPEQAAAYNKSYIDHVVQQVQKYNSQRGFIPQGKDANGNPIFTPEQIKQGAVEIQGKFIPNDPKNPNMGYKINMTPEEFDAVSSLASIDNYVAESKEYNDAMTKEMLLNKKVDADIFYKRMMGGSAQTKARAYAANLHSQIKMRDSKVAKEKFVDDLYERNFVQQPTVLKSQPNGTVSSQIDAQNSVPIYYPKGKTVDMLIPIGATPKYSDKDYKDGKLKVGAKPIGYEGGHYEVEYLSHSGKYLNFQTLADNYNKYKKLYNKITPEQKVNVEPINSFDEYIKSAVKNKNYDFRLKGQNATVDRGFFQSGQMQLSEQVSKKGDGGIWDVSEAPTDEQVPTESSSYEKITDNEISK